MRQHWECGETAICLLCIIHLCKLLVEICIEQDSTWQDSEGWSCCASFGPQP